MRVICPYSNKQMNSFLLHVVFLFRLLRMCIAIRIYTLCIAYTGNTDAIYRILILSMIISYAHTSTPFVCIGGVFIQIIRWFTFNTQQKFLIPFCSILRPKTIKSFIFKFDFSLFYYEFNFDSI